MSLTATTEEKGDVSVVRASGKITIGEGEVYLRDIIQKLSTDGRKKILLDLGNVSFVDSSGLGALIGTYSSVFIAAPIVHSRVRRRQLAEARA